MRNTLSKEKLKMRPPLPSSICDLDSLFEGYEPVKLIYKSYVISEDNKYSYIFTSDKLLKILNESSEIFIDGTFSVSIIYIYIWACVRACVRVRVCVCVYNNYYISYVITLYTYCTLHLTIISGCT